MVILNEQVFILIIIFYYKVHLIYASHQHHHFDLCLSWENLIKILSFLLNSDHISIRLIVIPFFIYFNIFLFFFYLFIIFFFFFIDLIQ